MIHPMLFRRLVGSPGMPLPMTALVLKTPIDGSRVTARRTYPALEMKHFAKAIRAMIPQNAFVTRKTSKLDRMLASPRTSDSMPLNLSLTRRASSMHHLQNQEHGVTYLALNRRIFLMMRLLFNSKIRYSRFQVPALSSLERMVWNLSLQSSPNFFNLCYRPIYVILTDLSHSHSLLLPVHFSLVLFMSPVQRIVVASTACFAWL